MGREGAKYRAHANPTNTHTSPPKPFPPKPFPAGRTRHVRPPVPERSPPGVTLPQLQRQQDARRVIREGGDSAQAGQGAGHGSAEQGAGGDRGSAQRQTQGAGLGARGKGRGRKRGQGTEASNSGGGKSTGSGRQDAGQGAGKGHGHGKGTQGREQGAKAGGQGAHGVERGVVSERERSLGHGHGHGKDTGASRAGQGTGDRGQDQHVDRGTKAWGRGRDPRARVRAPWALGDRQDGAWKPWGEGGARGEGRGAGRPHSRTCSQCGASPPGIQQMPAHHTHHHHHHHAHLYNIDLDAGDLIPPPTPRPQHQPAPPALRAEPARMAAASAAEGRDAAPAPRAQGPQGVAARRAEGAQPWDRDWDTVPDPMGGEALPLVVEVYGWLSWACSGNARGMRNRPFDAVLLGRDGGNREVPPGGWAAPEDHERILRTVIRAAWHDRAPTWPAFLEGEAVLRIMDADANN